MGVETDRQTEIRHRERRREGVEGGYDRRDDLTCTRTTSTVVHKAGPDVVDDVKTRQTAVTRSCSEHFL